MLLLLLLLLAARASHPEAAIITKKALDACWQRNANTSSTGPDVLRDNRARRTLLAIPERRGGYDIDIAITEGRR
jgi:hypothetical protein